MDCALNEEWRKVPGLSRYSASNLGRIRRDVRIYRSDPGVIAQSATKAGHMKVSVVTDEGRYRTTHAHVLVAAAFHGPRPDGFVTRHMNGNGADNRPENLAYGTGVDNAADALSHGTQVRGSRQHLAVLSEMQVRHLKLLRVEQGCSMNKLAALFEVSKSTVFDILKGRTWGHVEPTGDIRRQHLIELAPGERKTSAGRTERLWRLC